MTYDSLFSALETSATGLRAQRVRMNVISNNIANANTTRGPDGTCYKRQEVIFATILRGALAGRGVRVAGVVDDNGEPIKIFNPDHPDAKDGYVLMPNVSVVEEMVDMISAERSYEANVMALKAARGMALKALEIGRP